MNRRRKEARPPMAYAPYREPVDKTGSDINPRFSGKTFFCQGCGAELDVPNKFLHTIPPGAPMFLKRCGCTARQELTEFHDQCTKCKGPIYLTPGAAMRKKYCKHNGEPYEQPKKYCDDCLNGVIFTGPCRNRGCRSIGGNGQVSETLSDKIFYEENSLTFPPTNCKACREKKKEIKATRPLTLNCELCNKVFRVSAKEFLMILKTQEVFGNPSKCFRCRSLSVEDLRKAEKEARAEARRHALLDSFSKLVEGDTRALANLSAEARKRKGALKRAARQTIEYELKLKSESIYDVEKYRQNVAGTVSMMLEMKDPEEKGEKELKKDSAYRYTHRYFKDSKQLEAYIGKSGKLCYSNEYPHIHLIFQPETKKAQGRVDIIPTTRTHRLDESNISSADADEIIDTLLDFLILINKEYADASIP